MEGRRTGRGDDGLRGRRVGNPPLERHEVRLRGLLDGVSCDEGRGVVELGSGPRWCSPGLSRRSLDLSRADAEGAVGSADAAGVDGILRHVYPSVTDSPRAAPAPKLAT